MEMDSKILDKIEKMIELQKRAATQGEAEAAGAAIARLMTKYNLDMMEVNKRLGAKAPVSEFMQDQITLPGVTTWMRLLTFEISKMMFCKAYVNPASKSMGIIGEAHNIAVVRQMVLTMIPNLQAQARKQFKLLNDAGQIPQIYEKIRGTYRYGYVTQGLARWSNSFLDGAVEGIKDAIRAAKQVEIESFKSGNELVIVKDKELKAFVNKTVRLKSATLERSGGTGQAAGYAYGRSLNVGAKELN